MIHNLIKGEIQTRDRKREDHVKKHREKMAMWLSESIFTPKNTKSRQKTPEAKRS